MYKDNLTNVINKTIANLIDRELLHVGTEYKQGKGIVRTLKGGNYSTICYGTANECIKFLDGIEYLDNK